MLRAATRQYILQIIEDSFFGTQNYNVEFHSAGTSIVTINFLPERQFQFFIRRPDEEGYYKFVEAPGHRFTTPETSHTQDFDNVLTAIREWTERIREEIVSSNPFARELSAFKEQVELRLEEIGEDLTSFFSNVEAAELNSRLDEFDSRIDELVQKNVELEASVSQLRSALSDLKDSLQVVDKGTWYRMSAGRMVSGLKAIVTSKEARTFALDAARKFFLEAPK